MAETKGTKILNIYPTKTSKRFLVAIADIMITFILSVFLFEVAGKPIMKATTYYKENSDIYILYEQNRTQILYDNDLLFYDNVESEKYNFTANLERTSNKFIRYYSFGEEDKKFETVYHYFVDLRSKDASFVNELYKKYGAKYFDENKFSSLGTYALKDEYVNFFKPNFEKGNEMSEAGKKHYEDFQNNVFLNLFKEIFNDISHENDLKTSQNQTFLSYNEYTKQILNAEQNIQFGNVITTYIIFSIVAGSLFFVYPLINHKGQTISEKVGKIEHVDRYTLEYLPLRYRLILSSFNTLNSLSIIFTVPVLSYGFANLFSLPQLYAVSAIAILFLIIEIIFMFTTNLNQTIKEIGTNSIVVDSGLMDQYYKEKGYGN